MLPALAAAAALAGCSGGSAKVTSAGAAVRHSAATAPVRQPSRYRPHNLPPVQVVPGVQGVIGATANDLTRQFGPARLDVWEGDARKLQFVGPACLLDVYLYPADTGREPQASYVDARRPSDGQDVDRAACITALRQR